MPLQAWGSFCQEMQGLGPSPPLHPDLEPLLGRATPLWPERTRVLTCSCCEAADFPVFLLPRGPGAGPLPPAALSCTSVSKHKEVRLGRKAGCSGAAAPPDQAPIATGPAPGKARAMFPRGSWKWPEEQAQGCSIPCPGVQQASRAEWLRESTD